jgi:hypothetical protein
MTRRYARECAVTRTGAQEKNFKKDLTWFCRLELPTPAPPLHAVGKGRTAQLPSRFFLAAPGTSWMGRFCPSQPQPGGPHNPSRLCRTALA